MDTGSSVVLGMRVGPSSGGSAGAAAHPGSCPAGLGRPAASGTGTVESWGT